MKKVTDKEWKLKADNLQERRKINPIKPNMKLYSDIVSQVHVGKDVLDLGCGQGYLKQFIKGKYIGVDPFPIGDFIEMKAENLDIKCDTLFALAMLDNVQDVQVALKRMKQCAKENIVILTGIGINPDQYHTHKIEKDMLYKALGTPYKEIEVSPKVWLFEWRMNLPLVSIIIPYKVDRGWLNKAVESVDNQTYAGDIELIYSQSDNGVSYNLNRGIEMAEGEFVKYLCDDDWLTPNSIADSVRAMDGVDFIHGNALNHYSETNVQLQRPRMMHPTLRDMLINNVIHGGTLMYRRDVFDKVGLFDETLISAEEYDMNLKCLKAGLKLGYCDATLYNYRRHENQKSLGKFVDQIERKKRIDDIKNRYR